jgi:preprotein translocase subunit SecY
VEDIRKKLLFILLLLLIYRFGAMIPLPGIDLNMLYMVRGGADGFQADAIMTMFALITGGGIASVFAMGIAPYITASIIMQLLTYAIPTLSAMQKEGEDGRKKVQQITRYLAVALAALQGAATVFSYTQWPPGMGGHNLFREGHQTMYVYVLATLAMIAGTMFIMWLAELLTEKGIGNGASFLIFANILAGLPAGAANLWLMVTGDPSLMNIISVVVLLAVFVGIIAFVVLVHEGERRIPVQYSRKASSTKGMFGNHNSYIPLKVNIAGVLSIIFAMTFLQLPVQISQFFPGFGPAQAIAAYLDFNNLHWIGIITYIVLIFAFTHLYTSFAVNPIEMAENMKKNGGFIPGIRPGRPTSEFIQTTVNRLSWIGAVFYSLIAITPILLQRAVPGVGIGFGGTSLLIVTGVALEFVKQMESQLLMRHYKGFLE